ncbi:flagellar hook-associated protein 2 [Psychrobacillus sp. NPDC096426]|uniref:flagellar hook-associated protein 2 n=1 Tax=Psychrobacillus sp. NPDC096426 TaxID=3364491 RepID=UPI00380475EB
MAGLRVGGLASGMDIDSIVADLMKAERIPLDKLTAKKTTYEWQRDAFRSVNTKLKTFDDYLFNNFSLSSNFNKKTVSNTNSDLLSATANSSATGTLSIEKVTQLATAARAVGSEVKTTANTTATGSSKMSELGIAADTSISLKSIKADGTMSDAVKIDIKSTDTIDQVVSRINSSNAGVTALFEGGKISITAKNTGDNKDGAEIQVTEDTNGVFAKLGVNFNNLTAGQNAKFSVNGLETERPSNTFAISGYSVTLKSTFNIDSNSNTVAPVQLKADTDIDSMVDKVKEFVEKYNELISGMNDSLKEKKYRDFPPLTDEQRKDMSEKEQELWDEKAKSGLLKNDAIISSGLGHMRNAIYGKVGNGANIIDTLAEMGITTSSIYSDGGKLVIDEDKLKKALTENPDQVVKTLTNSGTKTTGEDTRGIVQRLRDSIKDFTGKIEKKAGKATFTDQQYTIGKSLIDMNNRITNFQRRLEDIESRYWRQFTAMEKAISQANQQSSFLMGQFNGG